MKWRDVLHGRTHEVPASTSRLIGAAAGVSVAAYLLLQVLSSDRPLDYTDEMLLAAEIMERATSVTRDYCDSAGIEIDEAVDPNRTCLIGPELTELMTTLGHLDAKRTTTDPAVASLIVHLLDQVGVSQGDTIAIGSSASFPALLVAALAAAEAMDVHAVTIISLGSSTFGATNPLFHLLDLHTLLLDNDILQAGLAGISLGGGKDVGEGFEPTLREALLRQISASGIPFINQPDLRENVATRMSIYGGDPPTGRIAAFVNAGGSYANMGTSELALRLAPGINRRIRLPPEEERGVLFEMAEREVPIIHLLFIRGLALRYGLLWDPIPLRVPGDMAIHGDRARTETSLWLVGVPYLVAVSVLMAFAVRSGPHRIQS